MNRGIWGLAVVLLLSAVAAWWLTRPPVPPPARPAPSPEVLAKLARGVNLSNWIQDGPPHDAQRYAPDAADWKLIRALGFSHARIMVDPDFFIGARGLPRPAALAELRVAVDGAVKEGLLVVIALQLPAEAKASLQGEAQRHALGGAWRALASSLDHLKPGQLVVEPLNESGIEDAGDSQRLYAFLVSAIRPVLPAHTFVVAGHRYAGVAELARMRPLEDANVVYAFHFYEPHNFTHQGATWGAKLWRSLRNFPYPSSPERVAPLLARTPPALVPVLEWHGEERWSRAKVDGLIGRAARWRDQHQVPVWCGEFGVLKKRVATGDRAAWLRDVRESLERHGIPWTHWDYASDFGVVGGPRGKRVVDKVAAEALGLHRPSP